MIQYYLFFSKKYNYLKVNFRNQIRQVRAGALRYLGTAPSFSFFTKQWLRTKTILSSKESYSFEAAWPE